MEIHQNTSPNLSNPTYYITVLMEVNCLLFKPFINFKLSFTSKLINHCSVHKTMFIFVCIAMVCYLKQHFFYFYKEDYLDIHQILSGCNGLEQSLEMSYVLKENLEGANKYKCGSCGKLVNAIKVCSCMKIFQSKPSLLYVAQTGEGQGRGGI